MSRLKAGMHSGEKNQSTPLKNDWEFNVLGVYNYRKPGYLRHYFNYLMEHHDHVEGDILEAGVYSGRSILAAGLLLKELGSSKQIYGFDTFSGFPPIVHEKDDLANFDELRKTGKITKEHYGQVLKNQRFRSLDLKDGVSVRNISLSGDFSNVVLEELKQKIAFLELDNIHLVQGLFADTMTDSRSPPRQIMAALMDCDLYLSYMSSLPFIWKRLTRGGYVYLDEYYSLKFAGARFATDEFFADKPDKPQKHKDEPGDFERWYVRKIHGDS